MAPGVARVTSGKTWEDLGRHPQTAGKGQPWSHFRRVCRPGEESGPENRAPGGDGSTRLRLVGKGVAVGTCQRTRLPQERQQQSRGVGQRGDGLVMVQSSWACQVGKERPPGPLEGGRGHAEGTRLGRQRVGHGQTAPRKEPWFRGGDGGAGPGRQHLSGKGSSH